MGRPSAGPPRMTEKGAPLAERQEHRTASLPGGRYGGTRSGAAVHVRRAARTSTTSTALIASPRYLPPPTPHQSPAELPRLDPISCRPQTCQDTHLIRHNVLSLQP